MRRKKKLEGGRYSAYRDHKSLPVSDDTFGRSRVGPVKISRKYLALQSAAISIFYGK
jgi:hypothetical protein